MYDVDKKDKVIKLNGVPQSSIGAPIPIVLADEHKIFLSYYLQDTPEDWDGTTVRLVDNETDSEAVALVKFDWCYSHMFGPPNDEAFEGHPLSNRGLRPYGAFEVLNSSWLRKLEKMNSVHSYHNKANFMKDKRHYIFSFHDSVFECIAKDFDIEISKGSVKSTMLKVLEALS